MVQKAQSSFIEGPSGQIETRILLPGARQDESLKKGAKNHQAWVVISHPHPQFGGTMDNKVVATLEKSFQALGYGTLVFNFRGVGASEGSYDGGTGEQQDLATTVAWLRAQFDVKQLILAGFSFGTYISLKQHEALQADGLCLLAPPVNLYDYSQFRLNGKPCSVIQGGVDEVVPAEEVRDWIISQQVDSADSAKLDVYWRAEASHYFHRQLVWLKQLILAIY